VPKPLVDALAIRAGHGLSAAPCSPPAAP
jgi:hypothetical protein